MRVVVLVGSHRYRHPVAARQGDDRFFFFDHRTPPAERQAFIARHVPLDEIESTDTYSFGPPSDCAVGHRWGAVAACRGIVALRCVRCGHTDDLDEPYPGQLNVAYINTA